MTRMTRMTRMIFKNCVASCILSRKDHTEPRGGNVI